MYLINLNRYKKLEKDFARYNTLVFFFHVRIIEVLHNLFHFHTGLIRLERSLRTDFFECNALSLLSGIKKYGLTATLKPVTHPELSCYCAFTVIPFFSILSDGEEAVDCTKMCIF